MIFFFQSRVFLFYSSKNRQGSCVPMTQGARVPRVSQRKLVPVRIRDSQTPHESAVKELLKLTQISVFHTRGQR